MCLERKCRESVEIEAPNGDKLKVVVIVIRGKNRVRLGFEAPPGYQIVRDDAKDKYPRDRFPKSSVPLPMVRGTMP